MIIYHYTAQCKVCQFFLFARFYYLQQTIPTEKNMRGRLNSLYLRSPKLTQNPSNANVQYNSISEHGRFKHTTSRYNNTLL